MTAGIYTLGCRVNQYESEAIAQALSERGVVVCDASEVCDAYIINTCTVTAESARKARQFIRKAKKENPLAYLLVTGCYAQTEADAIAGIGGVDYICGSSNKMSTVTTLLSLFEKGAKNSEPVISIPDGATAPFEPMSISSFGRTRAYVKIEDGCENHCAYCIIPAARGRVRSKCEGEVIKEVEGLIAGGFKEIVLTGIETAAYGRDLKDTDLISLLAKIDKIPGIERIRLGSLDPSFANKRFADAAANMEHLCPHFHLSLQSGCDNTLRAMRRKYNAKQAARNMEYLRSMIPNICFSADVIVGFPGESEADFTATRDFLAETKLLHGHIFSYSKRVGTEAAAMPYQIPEEIKKERNHILTALCDSTGESIIRSHEGKTLHVLFETWNGKRAVGHTENFIEVEVECHEDVRGSILPAKIIKAKDKIAIAKILQL